MALSENEMREIYRHIAEEVNVKRIEVNGRLVYEMPPMSARANEKRRQYEAMIASD